jgi:hypothetical protein
MKRTPLRAKRLKPRRNEGRVQHKRMKSPVATSPSAEQVAYWQSLPASCVVCRGVDAIIHHLLSPLPEKTSRRDHWYVVRLCPQCHNMGTQSVHLLGSESAFKRVHGVDLVAIAQRNLALWRGSQED